MVHVMQCFTNIQHEKPGHDTCQFHNNVVLLIFSSTDHITTYMYELTCM